MNYLFLFRLPEVMGNLMLNFSDEERVYKNGDKSQPLYLGYYYHIYVFTLYSLKGLWGEYRRLPQPAHVNHN